MKISKQTLSDLFKRYSTVTGQMDSHYKAFENIMYLKNVGKLR